MLRCNFKSVPEVILERQSRRPHIHAWMPTPQTLLSAVSVSDAVAIVPERLFELHKVNLKLKSMTQPFDIPAVKHKSVWHPRRDRKSTRLNSSQSLAPRMPLSA